jgi:RNA polymerase sigma-70 factor (ECF subfamily)
MTLADLYEQYEAPLQRYAQRLTTDWDEAEDLVQETFMRAMSHLALLQSLNAQQQRAWLQRTLKNRFLDACRTQRRQERLLAQLNPGESIGEEEIFAGILTPNPMEHMSAELRELFEMRYALGMNSTEIAEQLGLPAATVRSRLHFAIQKLRLYRANYE